MSENQKASETCIMINDRPQHSVAMRFSMVGRLPITLLQITAESVLKEFWK